MSDSTLSQFLNKTSLITYSSSTFEKTELTDIKEAVLTTSPAEVEWLNTYGLNYRAEIREVIKLNGLDDFLLKLLLDQNKTNKVIALEDCLYVSTRVLTSSERGFGSEHMLFIMSPTYLWSIQEQEGDYFDFIRERLIENKGLARKKNADYLLYLMMESIIDNYQSSFEKYSENNMVSLESASIKPTPEFSALIEQKKSDLFKIKRATSSFRDTLTKLEKIELVNFRSNYFIELRDQSTHLLDNIEFELQQLESSINLIFSMQGHRLNEVMKTLTILSVIFIPLTFLAGIYGMNFRNIPELDFQYGYYVLLAVMLVITLLSVWYFRRKKWF